MYAHFAGSINAGSLRQIFSNFSIPTTIRNFLEIRKRLIKENNQFQF